MLGDADLLKRRHIREEARARLAHHRERPQLSVLDIGRHRRHHIHEDLRLPGKRGLHRRRTALERNVRDLETMRDLEQILADKVRRRTKARRRIIVFVGIGFDQRDQLLHAFGRHRGIDHDQFGTGDDEGDGREILERIERHFRAQHRLHHHVLRRQQDGVAVRSGLRRIGNADRGAGAADILDVELHAVLLGQFLRNETRDGVGRSARRIRHNNSDRPIRIFLSLGLPEGCGSEECKRRREHTLSNWTHILPRS